MNIDAASRLTQFEDQAFTVETTAKTFWKGRLMKLF